MSVIKLEQARLSPERIEAFYSDKLTNAQVADFISLMQPRLAGVRKVIDIGGGRGHFARQVAERMALATRVIDSDERSISLCRQDYGHKVDCEVGDALQPQIHGDEDVICFNLVLHHLVAGTERETRELQMRALAAWLRQAKYVFVNEYIYESHLRNLSGRIIFGITSSSTLSRIAAFVGRFVPALRANTAGVGVRFRAHDEWKQLFEECGLRVVATIQGKREPLLAARKLLLIKEMRKDSFLLVPDSPSSSRRDSTPS